MRNMEFPSKTRPNTSCLALLICAFQLLGFGCSKAASNPTDNLAEFRRNASDLKNKGIVRDTALVMEYQVNRHTNTCTNQLPESTLRLYGDGRLSLLYTRSFADSDRNGPGSFIGSISKGEWKSLFAQLSRMEWVESSGILPMPGMSESNFVILLYSKGRQEVFSFTGNIPPNQNRIVDGLKATSDLVRRAKKDTLWNVKLTGSAKKVGHELLLVETKWSLTGKQSIKFNLPLVSVNYPACGSMGLHWYSTRNERAGTKTYPILNIQMPPMDTLPDGGFWKELSPGESFSVQLKFSLTEGHKVGSKGKLNHLGMSIVLPEAGDTLGASLFSKEFDF